MPIFILLQKQQSMQTLRLYFVKPLMIGTISNDITRGKRLTTWRLPIPFCMYFLHILQTSVSSHAPHMPTKAAKNVALCATRN